MANPVKVRTFGLIPTIAKPFTMARKRCPQVSPIFLVIMTICPKGPRGARSSPHPPRGTAFPSFLASRWATPSAVRQARSRRDQITTKTLGKQSSHQRGCEATRDPLPTLLPTVSLLLINSSPRCGWLGAQSSADRLPPRGCHRIPPWRQQGPGGDTVEGPSVERLRLA